MKLGHWLHTSPSWSRTPSPPPAHNTHPEPVSFPGTIQAFVTWWEAGLAFIRTEGEGDERLYSRYCVCVCVCVCVCECVFVNDLWVHFPTMSCWESLSLPGFYSHFCIMFLFSCVDWGFLYTEMCKTACYLGVLWSTVSATRTHEKIQMMWMELFVIY